MKRSDFLKNVLALGAFIGIAPKVVADKKYIGNTKHPYIMDEVGKVRQYPLTEKECYRNQIIHTHISYFDHRIAVVSDGIIIELQKRFDNRPKNINDPFLPRLKHEETIFNVFKNVTNPHVHDDFIIVDSSDNRGYFILKGDTKFFL